MSKAYADCLVAIISGDMDEKELNHLHDFIAETLRTKRYDKVAEMKRTLEPGDIVTLHGLRGPINGLEVEVLEIKQTRFVAFIPGKGRVSIPLSCATKV